MSVLSKQHSEFLQSTVVNKPCPQFQFYQQFIYPLARTRVLLKQLCLNNITNRATLCNEYLTAKCHLSHICIHIEYIVDSAWLFVVLFHWVLFSGLCLITPSCASRRSTVHVYLTCKLGSTKSKDLCTCAKIPPLCTNERKDKWGKTKGLLKLK